MFGRTVVGGINFSFSPSRTPMRSCSHTKGFGAHQFHLPSTCMEAGSSTIRTSVASTRTASVRPSPSIRMNCTWAPNRAANDIDITSAAAVITRPVRANPSATLLSLSARVRPDSSQYSRIRASRNTS